MLRRLDNASDPRLLAARGFLLGQARAVALNRSLSPAQPGPAAQTALAQTAPAAGLLLGSKPDEMSLNIHTAWFTSEAVSDNGKRRTEAFLVLQTYGTGKPAAHAANVALPLGRSVTPCIAVAAPLALPGADAGEAPDVPHAPGLAYCGVPLSASPTRLPIHIDGMPADITSENSCLCAPNKQKYHKDRFI